MHSGFGHEARRVGAVLWKDLTIERRAKANFNSVAFLAALILLMFGFAIGPDRETALATVPGVIWLTVLFSGVLSFNRSYEQELENGALDMMLLYPGAQRSIFLGKLLANLVFVMGVELVLIPAAAVLYNLPLGRVFLPLAGIVLLGTVGFVTLGTFYAAMASRLRAREVLLPLLLVPMLVPVLIGAVQSTAEILSGNEMGRLGTWVQLLAIFDVIFLTAAVLAFEHVIGE